MSYKEEIDLDIECSPMLLELLECTKDLIVLEGSTRSGKTTNIVLLNIIDLIKADYPKVCRSLRDVGRDCLDTVGADFKKMMKMYFKDLWNPDCFNGTKGFYVFPHNNATYHFSGCDTDRLHGYSQDRLHCNEVMSMKKDDWDQASVRTSGVKILDYNPSLTRHWVFDTILSQDPGKYHYIHSTYKDNPYLTDTQVADIEKRQPTEENIRNKTADEWWWTVYGEGKRGKRPGTILQHWDLVDFFPEKKNAQRWGYFLDWGYSIDPTALGRAALFNGELYAQELIYETGLTTLKSISRPSIKNLQTLLEELGVDKNDLIIADSSNPQAIADLSGAGYNIVGTDKSASKLPEVKGESNKSWINRGLSLVNTYITHLHRSSQNAQAEFENYIYKTNRMTKEITDYPEDANNHFIDGFRGWVSYHCNPLEGYQEKREVKPLRFKNRFAA